MVEFRLEDVASEQASVWVNGHREYGGSGWTLQRAEYRARVVRPEGEEEWRVTSLALLRFS